MDWVRRPNLVVEDFFLLSVWPIVINLGEQFLNKNKKKKQVEL
jgi:hypothetical protein